MPLVFTMTRDHKCGLRALVYSLTVLIIIYLVWEKHFLDILPKKPFCASRKKKEYYVWNNTLWQDLHFWERDTSIMLDFSNAINFVEITHIFFRLLRRWKRCTYSVWSPGTVSSQWEFFSLSCTCTAPPGRPAHLCGTPHPSPPSGYPRASLFYNCFHYWCAWAWTLLILSPPSSKHQKAKRHLRMLKSMLGLSQLHQKNIKR